MMHQAYFCHDPVTKVIIMDKWLRDIDVSFSDILEGDFYI